MRKKVLIGYCVISILFLLFFIVACLGSSLDIRHAKWPQGYEKIKDYSATTVNDNILPVGRKNCFIFRVGQISDDYDTLMFYSNHQMVYVYVGEQCIYQAIPVKTAFTWRSPGRFWNQVQLEEEYVNQSIRIELIPLYDDVITEELDIRFGCRYDMIQSIISEDFLLIVFSAFAILVGVIYLLIVVSLYLFKRNIQVSGLLGWLYILVGLWKLTDSSCFCLWVKDFPGLSMWPGLVLILMPIPFSLAVHDMCRQEKSKLWIIPCAYSFINMTVVLVCQVTQVADLRKTLITTHLGLLLTLACVITMTIMEIKEFGIKDRETRVTVFCVASCLLWVLCDLVGYYGHNVVTDAMALVGMFGFLTHIVMVSVRGVRRAKSMMEVGMHARQFEKIAFHNQLTGLYNRTALADFINTVDVSSQEYIMAVFDLNNLKKCNDTYGHEAGDMYIREAAEIIKECFIDIGHCYRQGGDEFTVVLTNIDLELCERRMGEMKEKVAQFNRKSHDIKMGIASGFAKFDSTQDEFISDTIKRADKLMYQEKFLMKQQLAQKEQQGETE